MNREETLAEVRRRLARVAPDQAAADPADLLMRDELEALERALLAGQPFTDAWETHELSWIARTAQTQGEIVRGAARIMLAFEGFRARNPLYGAGHPELEELFEWWLHQGGREEFLGQLPLEQRRALEKKAQERSERDDRDPPF